MYLNSRLALICSFLIIPLVICLTLPFAPSASADSPNVHVVGWGDTLFSIANHNGTSVNALMQANNLRDANFIWVGQRLIIPGSSIPAPQPSATYVVQSGDTLFSIATRNGIGVDALMRANKLTNYWIYVDQSLKIPGQYGPPQPPTQPLPPPKGAYYIVHPGDYLSMVAAQYGSSVYGIQIANQLPNPSFIWVGQRLFIPGGIAPANLPTNKPLPPIYPGLPIIPAVIPQNGQVPGLYPPTATPLPPVGVATPIPPVVIQPLSQPGSNASGIWEAILITNTVGNGPCSLGAFVDGKTDWPVVVATTDGTWISDPKTTGNKPERGPYYVEFANSCGGVWRVIPLGLNIYADVQLSGGHAEVEFRQRP
jgi:LysM repeat protein